VTNIFESTVNILKQTVENAIKAAFGGDFAVPGFAVQVPKEAGHGDFAANAAMILAGSLKKPPRVIAEAIIENINDCSVIEKTEIAGPGFINFHLKKDWAASCLNEIEVLGDNYGSSDLGKNKKVMVEFVSANPTGPMHMGNARGGAVGGSLAAALSLAGFDVTREFYINDSGAQIEKFGLSLEGRYLELLDQPTEFDEGWYQGGDIRDHARNYIDINKDKLLSETPESRRAALVDYALPKNIAHIKETMPKYGIDFDVWFFESELYKSGEVDETVEILKNSGLTYEKDGALWLRFVPENAADNNSAETKDDVLIRANGIPTYFAADIAYHRNKFIKRGFDTVINIWGADHHGHIARLKSAMAAIGIDPGRLVIIIVQMVRLMQGGEVVRMSKRTGRMITLNDLIDDIGTDAARFFFNLRQCGSHFDFDLSLAAEKTNDNPVFYVQYAHARICSILRLLAEDGITVLPYDKINPALLETPEELALIKTLSVFPEEIKQTAINREPSRLTRYAADLASNFHSFYNACRVRGGDEALSAARLKLVDSVRTVIKNTLRLLGVTAPETM